MQPVITGDSNDSTLLSQAGLKFVLAVRSPPILTVGRQQLITTTLGQGRISGVVRMDMSCALIEMSPPAEDTTGLVIAMTGARAHAYNGCNHNPTVYVPNRHWEL